MLIFSAGAKSLQDAVKPLRQQGITTFIFRIGSEPGQRELLSAVDRPGNLVTFSGFADMDARVPYVARQIPFYSGKWQPVLQGVCVHTPLVSLIEPICPTSGIEHLRKQCEGLDLGVDTKRKVSIAFLACLGCKFSVLIIFMKHKIVIIILLDDKTVEFQ